MIYIESILNFLNSVNIKFIFHGNKKAAIAGYSSLKNYKKDTLTWAKNEAAYQYNFSDKALVIVQEGLDIKAQNVIISNESRRAFFSLIEFMAEPDDSFANSQTIGTGTILGEHVLIGKNVIIGSNCTIQGHVIIGDNTRIWNNVTIINNVTIGTDCEIQSGCVIGHDGFAWIEQSNHKKDMIKHFGGVEIKDCVFIGPNCIIDRGEIDNTVIGEGVKMDASCFVAHNAILGKNVIMITGSRLYGSSEIGDNAYIASAMVRNQCKIGANSFIGMGAVVTNNLPANIIAMGIPAKIINKGENHV